MVDHREKSLKMNSHNAMQKAPQRCSGKKRNHPLRINILVNCKLLLFSPRYHNFQITVSNNKKAITLGQMYHKLGDAVPEP